MALLSDSVGSVSVDVVPDARGWAEKLRAQIRDQTVKMHVDADTAEAEAELDEVARDRRSEVKVDVDKSKIDEGAKSLGGFLANLGLIPTLAITAGSALIPLVATLGGVALALAAPLAIAGGGATLFAFLGGLAAKDTEAKLKNIDKLRQHLGTLTKGTAEYATAQKQLRDAEKALTPEQRKFADAQDKLTGAFQKFLEGKAGRSLLDVMAQGMGVLAHLLPIVAPVIVTVGHAISGLLTDVDHAAQSDGFKRVVDQFARLAGRDIRIGGHILGELAKGVGSLLLATDKGFSGGFLRGLDHLSSSFAGWASSKEARHEMRDFFGYVHDVGPQVGHTLGAIAHAAGQLIRALAPLGPPTLKAIEGMANAISAIPTPVLTGLAAAFVAATAAAKVSKGLGGLGALARLGGGSTSGGILGSLGGIQKVYVVNLPPTGLGGGIPGGPGGVAGELGTAAEGAAGATFASRFLGSLRGLLTVRGAGPALITAGDAGNEVRHSPGFTIDGLPNTASASDFGLKALALAKAKADQRAIEQSFGLTAQQVRSVLDVPQIKATATHLDALRAHAQRASQQIDQIGPHASASFGAASKDVDTFAGKLNAIHDKKIAVILQDQAAVRSLERLQAMRIADKNFNVYAHYQQSERGVGPGGGMGQNPHGSAGGGASGRTPVHVHLDDSGRASFTGYIQGAIDDNTQFERQHR